MIVNNDREPEEMLRHLQTPLDTPRHHLSVMTTQSIHELTAPHCGMIRPREDFQVAVRIVSGSSWRDQLSIRHLYSDSAGLFSLVSQFFNDEHFTAFHRSPSKDRWLLMAQVKTKEAVRDNFHIILLSLGRQILESDTRQAGARAVGDNFPCGGRSPPARLTTRGWDKYTASPALHLQD